MPGLFLNFLPKGVALACACGVDEDVDEGDFAFSLEAVFSPCFFGGLKVFFQLGEPGFDVAGEGVTAAEGR